MAEIYEGADFSHWQGPFTAEIVATMYSKGIRFAYVKFTQGSGYTDPEAINNSRLLKAGGILPGPYHFTTLDNAALQLSNFVEYMAEAEIEFDLPPAMDCEAFTTISGEVYSLREVKMLLSPELRYYGAIPSGRMRVLLAANKGGETALRLAVRALYGLSYPTQAIVDSIGGTSDDKGLTAWMRKFPKLQPFAYPSIYTNPASGNKIFTSTKMNRYLLWLAHWRVPVPMPPKIWYGKPIYVWQNDVIDGKPYGLQSQMDHNLWGQQFDFPGAEPPPPPPDEDEWIDVVGTHHPSGKIFTGRMLPEGE